MVHAELRDLFVTQYAQVVGGMAKCRAMTDEKLQRIALGIAGQRLHLPGDVVGYP